SSITAATLGTRSSISRGKSCPSPAAIGQPQVTQFEDWYKRLYSRSELADWSSRRVASVVHNRGRSRARGRNPNAGATQRRRTNLGRAVLAGRRFFATSRKP